MNQPTGIERELLWSDDGHLTEVALTAIADGEEALVPGGEAHLEGCADCLGRLGAAALLRIDAGEALAAASEAKRARAGARSEAAANGRRLRAAHRGRGGRWAGAALLVAAIAAIPIAPGALDAVRSAPTGLVKAAPVLTRTALVLARTAGRDLEPRMAAISWLSALVLILIGAAVARSASRKASLKGEAR